MASDLLRNMYKTSRPPMPSPLQHSTTDLIEDTVVEERLDHEEAMDSVSTDLCTTSLTFQDPTPAIHPSKNPAVFNVASRYGPLEWSNYFEEKSFVTVPCKNGKEQESNGNIITFAVYQIRGRPGAPVFVMHHGAGSGALGFALSSKEIRNIVGMDASILCFDARGHGETTSSDDHNLSLDRLAKDLASVVHAVYGEHLPDIVLVGHSMGGAVVCEAASRGMIPNLIGVAILDIVEGIAIETLSHLHGWLERRPNNFRSIDRVIQWGVKSGTVRNTESARVSFPPLVQPTNESRTGQNPEYVWRTDLAASEQYWKEWFTGLTQKFLSSRTAKLLILAGTDRLDKDMTIAQMQGKFQLLVFPNSGHAVQEDEPGRMARELVAFWKRNERLVLPPRPAPVVAMPQGTGAMVPAQAQNAAVN
ncbi:Protein with carboxyl methyl esterase activity [Podila humilis]|nr:Protein with carboxyl methyl esterase activity [Podila humilis]